MQYDLAHAKGGIPDEDLRIEAWKAERRKKEAQRRNEEKAATMGARVDCELNSILSYTPTPTADLEGKTPVQGGEIDGFQDAAESLHSEDSGKLSTRRATNGIMRKLTFRRNKPHITVPPSETVHEVRLEEAGREQTAEPEEVQATGEGTEEQADTDKRKEQKKDGKDEDKDRDKDKGKDERRAKADHSDSDDDPSESDDDDDHSGRWNAVCVVCLRVYSKDPDLSIFLIKPGLAEETSSLVQGGEPAGATM